MSIYQKAQLFTLVLLVGAFTSCQPDSDDTTTQTVTYPYSLKYKEIVQGQIETYTASGQLTDTNISFNDDDIFDQENSIGADEIVFSAEKVASFIAPAGSPDKTEYDEAFKDMSVSSDNNTVTFTTGVPLIPTIQGKGEPTDEIIFTVSAYKILDDDGQGSSIEWSVNEPADTDFSIFINDLDNQDTLSVLKYTIIYEVE